MTLAIETEGGTAITVGSLQGVSVVGEFNEVEYFDADSIERSDVKRTQKRYPVTADFGSFDVQLIQQWLGGSGASSSSAVDSTDPQLFTLTGAVTQSGSSTDLQAKVFGVNFPTMPIFEATRDEFVEKNLEGTGARAQITEV